MRHRQKGMSVTELAVVLAIAGILVAVVINVVGIIRNHDADRINEAQRLAIHGAEAFGYGSVEVIRTVATEAPAKGCDAASVPVRLHATDAAGQRIELLACCRMQRSSSGCFYHDAP